MPPPVRPEADVRRYTGPLLAAVVIAAVPAVTLVWPRAWSAVWLLILQALLTAVGVATLLRLRYAYGGLPRLPSPATSDSQPVRIVDRNRDPGEWLTAHRNFQGRAREVADVLAFHDKVRQADRGGGTDGGTTGPLLLLLHGQGGVGKTALAQELARRLTDRYPDGRYYVNLGNAGDPRSPGEILTSLMNAVGWPDPPLPSTAERAKIFRALCADQRMLFVLDAARDPSQVLDILPAEPMCTVIVTSRRDLGARLGGRSWHVPTPDIGDALEHLYSVARVGEFDSPECAVELVNLCGRLPLAIQAAGERLAHEREAVCDLRGKLEDEDRRIEALSRRGRDIDEAVSTEFARLSEVERRALCLLSLVESATFAPTVLCHLLSVRLTVAERLMASLGDAQLLGAAGPDHLTGLARYRFNPLVKLFVQGRIEHDAELAAQCAEARQRLWLGYRDLVVWMLSRFDDEARLGDRYGPVDRPGWLPAGRLPEDAAPWVRAEYRDLVRCAQVAYEQGDWGLCWRVVARLGDCLPHGPLDELAKLFERGLDAAKRDGSEIGQIDVRIAQAGMLTARERYPAAHRLLQEAGEQAGSLLRARKQSRTVQRRLAHIDLRFGEGYLQMRSPELAQQSFERARRNFEEAGAVDEARMVRLLDDLNRDQSPGDEPPDEGAALDGYRFWSLVATAEAHRRGVQWDEAEQALRQAAGLYNADVRRTANVQYRLARLHLEHAMQLRSEGDAQARAHALLVRGLRRATQALLTFRGMDNGVGEVRARFMLVRLMAVAGQTQAAAREFDRATDLLDTLDEEVVGDALEPLRARQSLAEGYLQMSRNAADARGTLLRASRAFQGLRDVRNDTLAQDLARVLAD